MCLIMNTDKETLTKKKKRNISKLTWRNEKKSYNMIRSYKVRKRKRQHQNKINYKYKFQVKEVISSTQVIIMLNSSLKVKPPY